jgi:two-component system, cell cycle sensor histidine kinase and response regulator CckA
VRQFIATILENAGYRVLRARHGSEGIDVYRQEADRIRLVVTDLAMPHMSGPVLVESLMRLDPTLRVIYLSGYADVAFEGLGGPVPSALLLQKPFTGADLLHRVREALEGLLIDY